MEDSSVLKVRSDLYPDADAFAVDAMTSNIAVTNQDHPTCDENPIRECGSPKPALPTHPDCPMSSVNSSSVAPSSLIRNSITLPTEDFDSWKKVGINTTWTCEKDPPPVPLEESTFQLRDWTPPSPNNFDPCQKSHSASEGRTMENSEDVITRELNIRNKDSSVSELDEGENTERSAVVPNPSLSGTYHDISGEASSSEPPSPMDEPPYVSLPASSLISTPASQYSSASPPGAEVEEGCRSTLDLSTSSRSQDSFSRPPPQPTVSSPVVSRSAFSPYGMFHGLSRFPEMNPIFGDSFKPGILKAPYNSSLYTSNLPPHLLPLLLSSQIQNLVHHQQVTSLERNSGNIFGNCNGGFISQDGDQQPLDLSAKKQEAKPLINDDHVVFETKPSTRGRRRADNSKRSYTEEALSAALRDIQSRKLGTRRAAVIYGIPRSTLRNKVYKLQSVREKKGTEQKEKLSQILPDSTAHLQNLMMLPKETESNSTDEVPGEALKLMIRKKMTERLEELSRSSQIPLSGGDKQKLLDSALTYLCENIPKLALNTDHRMISSDISSSLSLYPQLQDFTHQIVEERFYEEIKKINSSVSDNAISEISTRPNSEEDQPLINIPSYPPMYRNQTNEHSLHSEKLKKESSHPYSGSPPQANLRDMIAHIVNQRIMGDIPMELSTPSSSSPHILPLSVQCMEQSVVKPDVKLPTEEKQPQDLNKKRSKSPSSSGGKGSRPKRGKYRNYDRDNLLKAVQAVQNGEMSVHRAGSFYGVPHSTLEYKVKERHLNKAKNKKESGLLPHVPFTKTGKENASSSTSFSSITYPRKQFKNDTPDTTTKDVSGGDTRQSDEISIISVHSPPPKISKIATEAEESVSVHPIPPNPFLSNPFPFWNSASPILAPFLSSQYQSEQLYASQSMDSFKRTDIKSNSLITRTHSPSSETKNSDSFPTEDFKGAQRLLLNGNPSSSIPPLSPPIHQSNLLTSLLRTKLETQFSGSSIQWPLSLLENPNNSADSNEHNTELDLDAIPPARLITLKALLPSFIAARSSLTSALNADTSMPESSKLMSTSLCSSTPIPTTTLSTTSLPMLNRCSHTPVVGGGSISETP